VLARALRATILDGRLYREIGDDPREMFYALGIVLLAAVAFGLGLKNASILSFPDAPSSVIIAMAASSKVTSWVLWTVLAFLLGRILGGKAGFRQLLRNLGFTFGPGVLGILFDIPWAGAYLFPLSFIWLYPAGLVAIKETHEIDWVRAIIVNSVAWTIGIFIVPALLVPIQSVGRM